MVAIERTVKLKARPETVYGWLSEPDHIQTWFCDTAEKTDQGMSFSWNQKDGGTIGFEMQILTDDAPHTFEYKSIEDKPTITRFDVAHDGEHTIVSLVETGFSDDEVGETMRQEHEGGWDFFLSRLQQMDQA